MRASRRSLGAAALAASILVATARPLRAQDSSSGYGRVSLFLEGGSASPFDGGASRSFNDAWASLAMRSGVGDKGSAFEYALEGRGRSTSAGDERENRFQLYDAWVGGRVAEGVLGARVGQMWLNELGALGAVGGLLLEVRPKGDWKAGRVRFGLFGGLDPKTWEAGYYDGVKKGGAYAVLEGANARRHVVGWVLVKNGSLTERSVVSVSNFVPAGRKLFVYQAAEYDLSGPGGQGTGGLSYLFANARWSVSTRVEVQGTYHHGRSVDTRTITQDELDGRPIDPKRLEGLLFETVGGRLAVEPVRGVRVWAGWARDRYNKDEAPGNRYSAGLYAGNVLKSRIDLNAIATRNDRPTGAYDSWYVSLGRSFGSALYLSVDYSTAASVIRTTGTGGIVVETRPSSRRYTLNGLVNLTRDLSLQVTVERLTDDVEAATRGSAGLTYRF